MKKECRVHYTRDLGQVIMELTDQMVKPVQELFNIEIEILQGEQEKMEDGRTRYIFWVNQEKGELINKFILSIICKIPQSKN